MAYVRVSDLDSGLSGLGSSPGWCHRITFLGKVAKFYSQLTSTFDEPSGFIDL